MIIDIPEELINQIKEHEKEISEGDYYIPSEGCPDSYYAGCYASFIRKYIKNIKTQ